MEEQIFQPEEIKPASAEPACRLPAGQAGQAGLPAGKEEKKEEDELLRCQKEREEYLDGWRRAKAELLNYKKDEAKRFEQIIKLANEGLIKDLLVVLDSFDLGLMSLSPSGRSPEGREKDGLAHRGIYLIRSQLKDILKSYGLEEIMVALGQIFNPAIQEAVVEIESNQPPGTIIEEVEKGYLLNGRVIRPARVKVAK